MKEEIVEEKIDAKKEPKPLKKKEVLGNRTEAIAKDVVPAFLNLGLLIIKTIIFRVKNRFNKKDNQ